MPFVKTGPDDGVLRPMEGRGAPGARGASDWLDEVTADACGARGLAILLHAIVHDANPRAIATARQLQHAFADG